MADEAADWLQDKFLGWISAPPINKIDTHHHYVPSFYSKGDPSGWPIPSWTPLRSKILMKRLGVKTAVLSATAPGACILEGQASFDLARKLNDYGAELRNKEPQTFALDTLHADGVTLFTRYGTGNVYLGHPSLEPIWAELNRRKCVVFVHPMHPADTTPVNELLPQPAIDYPHETTRAAMDMIIRGTRRKFPDCKVILSHAGGALPYLVTRVATPMRKAPELVGHNAHSGYGDFRSFYYDLALSASPSVLDLALKIIPHDHILYGVSRVSTDFSMDQSDFPYAPITAYPAFLEDLEKYDMGPELRDKINFGNAQHLIPRLRNNSKY
ncbi:2-amino-3-carboxymuconate-6-semialdehyde decarboxylase [Penicillium malachiteum]|nr:2-amino-3-carboxymuconate-6-semialdehyde decarboxylase [Penicillium malachiteum]